MAAVGATAGAAGAAAAAAAATAAAACLPIDAGVPTDFVAALWSANKTVLCSVSDNS